MDQPSAGLTSEQCDTLEQIRFRSETIKRREVERALRKLDGQDRLTDEQARHIEEMADEIVQSLLAVPQRAIQRSAARGEEFPFEAVRRIFTANSRGDE